MDRQTEAIYELHAQVLKTLANPKRLMIMDCLHSGPKTVGEIEAILGLPQANVSQHLALMRGQEIVVARREGNTIRYSLASEKIVQACDTFHEFLLERIQATQAMANHFLPVLPREGVGDSPASDRDLAALAARSGS